MNPKIKNIIIFVAVAVSLILIYIFFIKKAPEEENLVSSFPTSTTLSDTTETLNQNSLVAKDLLSTLLSVKSIKLEDSIFSDKAFLNLRDSSILLIPSGDEGRLNPFAPIGFDEVITSTESVTPEETDSPIDAIN